MCVVPFFRVLEYGESSFEVRFTFEFNLKVIEILSVLQGG